MVDAYRQPDRTRGRAQMQAVIDSLSHSVPSVLTGLITLGRTLRQHARSFLETGGFRPQLHPGR